jgi:hypothetical protein
MRCPAAVEVVGEQLAQKTTGRTALHVQLRRIRVGEHETASSQRFRPQSPRRIAAIIYKERVVLMSECLQRAPQLIGGTLLPSKVYALLVACQDAQAEARLRTGARLLYTFFVNKHT